MLTFLRKIRKSSLESGSTRNYLLYAVGEILLVMIGILLALQVNNWNDRQKQKQLEAKLIKELSIEMKQNHDLLQQSLDYHTRYDSISNAILYSWPKLAVADKINDIHETRWFWTTDLLSGTLNSIVSEYGLTIISDDSLKQFIASWDDKKNDFYENEELDAHLVHNQMYPLMSGHISLKRVDSFVHAEKKAQDELLKDGELMKQIESLYNSQPFENLLIQREHNRFWCIREIENLMDELDWAIAHTEVINSRN